MSDTNAAVIHKGDADFRAILDLAGVGMAQADPGSGRFIRVNRRYCEITGYSEDELMSMTFRDVTHPDDVERDSEAYRHVVRGEAPEYFSEKRYIRKDGKLIWVMVNAVVVRDEQGKPVRSVGVINDITERKRLEHELAERADYERTKLGETLHDSLGQQITGLGMMIEALRQEIQATSTPAALALLGKIEATVDQSKSQMRAIMNGLFPVDIDGRGLQAALERLVNETNDLYSVSCRLDGAVARTPQDSFVATQLYLIVREAVHNAAKHASANEVAIQLETDNGLRLTVRDDGVGMAGDTTQPGLGCRIMRHRASLIGARVTWESTEKQGTAVHCHLEQEPSPN